MRFLYFAGLAALCAFSDLASAQDCSNVLVRDVSFRSFSNDEQLKIFLSTNSSNYGKMQQSAAGNGGFLIDGIPIEFGLNWSQAKETQDKFRQTYRLDERNTSTAQYFESKVQEAAFTAYSDCIRATTSRFGLYLFLKEARGDSIVVGLTYRSPPNDVMKKKLFVSPGKGAALAAGQLGEFGPFKGNSYDNFVTIVRTDSKATLNISARAEAVAGFRSEDADKEVQSVEQSAEETVEPGKIIVTLAKGVLEQKVLSPIPPSPTLLKRSSHRVDVSRALAVNPQGVVNLRAEDERCLDTSGPDNFIRDARLENHDRRTAGLGYSWMFWERKPPKTGALDTSVCASVGCVITRP